MRDPTRSNEGWWALNCGLFTVPLAAGALTVVLFYALRALGLGLSPESVSRLFPGKVAMLSLLFSAAFIQYGYFFQMRWTDGQKIRAGDWPAIRQAQRFLEEARESTRQDPAFQEWKARLEHLADPEKYLAEMAAQNRPFFRRAFSVIFALVATCFLSVSSDLIWLLLLPRDIAVLREWSGAFLSSSFVVMAGALVGAALKVRVELIKFFDY
jgi:hypothetical protein